MTPPLDSRQSARCGRSSMFPEQGDRSHPTLAVWQGGTHASGGAGVCGGRCHLPWAPGTSSRRTWTIWDEVEKRGEDLSGEQVRKGSSGSWSIYPLGLWG